MSDYLVNNICPKCGAEHWVEEYWQATECDICGALLPNPEDTAPDRLEEL